MRINKNSIYRNVYLRINDKISIFLKNRWWKLSYFLLILGNVKVWYIIRWCNQNNWFLKDKRCLLLLNYWRYSLLIRKHMMKLILLDVICVKAGYLLVTLSRIGVILGRRHLDHWNHWYIDRMKLRDQNVGLMLNIEEWIPLPWNSYVLCVLCEIRLRLSVKLGLLPKIRELLRDVHIILSWVNFMWK